MRGTTLLIPIYATNAITFGFTSLLGMTTGNFIGLKGAASVRASIAMVTRFAVGITRRELGEKDRAESRRSALILFASTEGESQ